MKRGVPIDSGRDFGDDLDAEPGSASETGSAPLIRLRHILDTQQRRPSPVTETVPVLTVRVLGPLQIEGPFPRLTGQQQSLITALTCLGPQPRPSLIDLLWGGKAISASRFANLLSEVRSAVGRDRLVHDEQGRYQILDATTDLAAFANLVASANADRQSPQRQIQLLTTAIGLIRGRVFETGTGRYWRWLDDSYQLVSKAEELVVDGALCLVNVAGAEHNWPSAAWACDRALNAVPHDDRLVARLATIHLAQGRTVAAAELITRWEEAMRRMGVAEPPTDLRRLLAEHPIRSLTE